MKLQLKIELSDLFIFKNSLPLFEIKQLFLHIV